jgi:Ca-activated chloride channel homolog
MLGITIPRLCGVAFVCAIFVTDVQAQRLLPATFESNSAMVLIPVNITDRDGKTIPGLRAEDFAVFDEQAPQQIASFSSEDAPCSVGLVLDISGSMRYALSTTKRIADIFLKASNPEDEFLMLTVSSVPDADSRFTTETEALAQDVQATRPGGMTALLDTVYLGLNRMRKATRPRRAVVILSDGMDNQSRYSKRELMRLALESDVQVYTILVDGLSGASASAAPFVPSMVAKPWQQAAERQGPEALKELSEKTGGLYFHVRNDANGADAAARVARALRNEYIIGYRAPNSGASGKWHRVQVKSTVPKARIFARSGYYAQ